MKLTLKNVRRIPKVLKDITVPTWLVKMDEIRLKP